jgi:bacterioferritin
VLRYTQNAIAANGLSSEGVKQEFAEHAKEENEHLHMVAERIAVDHYRELIRYFGDNDPTTRVMIEGILAVEEEHASDMLDLLNLHGGK